MRTIFMGTPPFAVPALEALIAAGHDVVAVYTRAPQPAGRGKALAKSAVHVRAEALGLPVETPATLKTADAQAQFAAWNAEVAVVAAYGLLLPQAVLDAPVLGCINIHASLLPRWRGAAPIQRAILAGDTETGVTIMAMAAGLDTGPMILSDATPVGDKTAGALTAELAAMGARLVVEALAGTCPRVPQPDEGVTLAPKIGKAEARLDFGQTAEAVARAVRAFNPAPGAWTLIGGERLKILAASVVTGHFTPGVIADGQLTIGTAAGGLRPTLVQRAGKPAMPTADLLNGWPLPPGTAVDPA
ncbi:methionyl-tRNA formyltransferase [Polymorphobacter fuscus]|uniref:Methionyl-tRNA formyltransferase n=1 Tax=Sandarakinorhabdus fusca TaxID=1439888 RepID=A0A7C9KKW5_9SPHN|nr:methionyl-tRNA formyltransferase [Polymorphobacter fuscus]KAB7648389.1 methionyl-tRNA formyltransferase [Polymorphobacter fuscus]MQT15904.1 methionyl-tRNA formyltransferase [Polymorphobacter fuscus]NJC07822.1 methionyl-tRNA formyltransferase [Polymorphobacter fuscus]